MTIPHQEKTLDCTVDLFLQRVERPVLRGVEPAGEKKNLDYTVDLFLQNQNSLLMKSQK